MSTELELRPEDHTAHGFEVAEQVFTEERRKQIALFLNIDADDPALLPYLVTCATYGLSPIMGEIWLIPTKVTVRDGDAERKENRYRPAVGRDGYLSIARRDARFAGLQGATVCEHDTFEVEYTGDINSDPRVLHRFASKPTIAEDGEDPGRWRGKVLGAWAKAYAHGNPPTFYYASLREHGKLEQEFEWGQQRGERRLKWLDAEGKKTFENTGRPALRWAGSWDYTSSMILKAAQSYVLRIAFGITGLAPADELTGRETLAQPGIVAELPMPEEFDWSTLTAAEGVVERLRVAVEGANELAPMSWAPAKCEMVFAGMTGEALEAKAEEIERENELHARKIDPPADAEVAGEGEELTGQVEPQEPALTAEEAGRVDALRHREADLLAALDGAEVGSEEHGAYLQELRGVEGELREHGQPTGEPGE